MERNATRLLLSKLGISGKVIDFTSKYGVNLFELTERELCGIPGMGKKKVEAIMDYKKK